MMLGTGLVGMGRGGRDRHLGTAEGLVTQGQIPAVVVVVVTWVAGCAAVV